MWKRCPFFLNRNNYDITRKPGTVHFRQYYENVKLLKIFFLYLHTLLNSKYIHVPRNWPTSSDIYCIITVPYFKSIVHLRCRASLSYCLPLHSTVLHCTPLDITVPTRERIGFHFFKFSITFKVRIFVLDSVYFFFNPKTTLISCLLSFSRNKVFVFCVHYKGNCYIYKRLAIKGKRFKLKIFKL